MGFDRRTISHPQRLVDLEKIQNTLARHRLLWIVPTVLFGVLGLLHVATKHNEWSASQTLIVRDEAIGEMGFGYSVPLGRFESNDALKRCLETLLQVSKNREVLRAALQKVGPPAGEPTSSYPQAEDIEAFAKDMAVSAPAGTEFGTSEVIYLTVTAHPRDRAIRLAVAMCDELENRLRLLRNEYAKSMISELLEKEALAKRDLETSTDALSALESTIGEDLGEMRRLSAGTGGESFLQGQLNQIESELRQVENQLDEQRELLALLDQFDRDSEAILATPNRLLESQPGLRRLKDGLVDAKLQTARIRGGLTEAHPRVQSALQHEQNVERQLLEEVENVLVSIRAEQTLGRRRKESLENKRQQVQLRLDILASQRASYMNLTDEVEQRRDQLRLATTALAEARGRQEASKSSSLVTRVDQPVTGAHPDGPGRVVLLLGSVLVGLGVGLSLVYLLAPWQETLRGRRKTDRVGRRATDRQASGDPGDRRTPVAPAVDSEFNTELGPTWPENPLSD